MTRWLLVSAKAHANTVVFSAGLVILCLSIAVVSPPTAGMVLGLVLILVAVWPFLFRRTP